MLHADALAVLNILSRYSSQSIVEIGPRLGGSTIALCSDLKKNIITIEKGGSIDNSSIITELKTNLILYDIKKYVTLIEAPSFEPATIKKVRTLIDKAISLFVVDSDGQVDRELSDYYEMLDTNCILVFDDYISYNDGRRPPGGKENEVKAVVDRLLCNKAVESLGVYGWGTWVGKIVDKEKIKQPVSIAAGCL